MDDNTAVVPNIAEAAQATAEVYSPPSAPDLKANYAEDAKTKEWIQSHLLPVLTWTRTQRAGLEDEWVKIRNMVMLEHDEGQRYAGRSQVYLPSYSQARKTLVSQLTRGLFPSDDYMGVDADCTEAEKVAAIKLMKDQIERSARLRRGIKPFLRQKVDYGISVAKVWYKGKEENLKRVKRGPDLQSLFYEPDERLDYRCEGVKFEPRNVFFWYVYPTTASSLDEAQVMFEDILVPLQFIKDKLTRGQFLGGEDAKAAPTPANYNYNLQRLLASQGDMTTTPDSNPVGGSDLAALRVLTEVWCSMPLPSGAYTKDEESGSFVPCKVVMAGTVPVEVRRNPFWDQTPPYLMERSEWEVQSFYTRGEGHKARGLQYLVNDFSNQLNDNGAYGLNPIWLMNPSLFTGPITPVHPGVMWQGTDVDGMAKAITPPVEQLQYGLQLALHYAQWMDRSIGAPPILQGMGTGKGRTATGDQILQRNAMNPLQDEVEDLESDVAVPFMYKGWALIRQYMAMSKIRALSGAPLEINKRTPEIEFMFKWLASSQNANQQMRAQQIMQMLQLVLNPQMLRLIQMQQRGFNPIPWLRRLAGDGFGLRGFEESFPQMAAQPMQVPGQPPQPGMPGMQPGGVPPPGQEGGDRVRSAAEQNPFGDGAPTSASPVPGEGDDFMAVRQQADQLAGQFGGEQ
ncbi:MAG TPA: hypothetical protein VHL57_07470 [Flavobacteriales bacterium]|nr:hypothetical protein [Flavobacteriales bacterium]